MLSTDDREAAHNAWKDVHRFITFMRRIIHASNWRINETSDRRYNEPTKKEREKERSGLYTRSKPTGECDGSGM